jgi:hypothetical protein
VGRHLGRHPVAVDALERFASFSTAPASIELVRIRSEHRLDTIAQSSRDLDRIPAERDQPRRMRVP